MNRIKPLRMENKLSLQDLQNIFLKEYDMKVSRASLSNYERGEQQPKQEVWECLADYFNVSVPYIMGLSDVKKEIDKNKLKDLMLNANSVDFDRFTKYMSTFTDSQMKVITSSWYKLDSSEDLVMTLYFSFTNGEKTIFSALKNTVFIEDIHLNASVNPAKVSLTIFCDTTNQDDMLIDIFDLQSQDLLTEIDLKNFDSTFIVKYINAKKMVEEFETEMITMASQIIDNLKEARKDVFTDKLKYTVKMNFYNSQVFVVDLYYK